MNYFALLELPEKLTIDAADLEQRFYALSRKWHPDRFARAAAEDQQKALDASASLNDAYRTLRQPVARAAYFLKLKGIGETDSETAGDQAKVPPELLEEVFDLNMALEELKMGDTDSLPALRESQKRFEGMLLQADADLESDFALWDSTASAAALTGLRAHLHHRKYISNLVSETGKTLQNYVSD